MAFRSVRVSQPADLSVRQNRLYIKQGDKEAFVPMEDIATITLEDPSIRLSVNVLRQAAHHGVVVLSCDQTHLPNGIFQSFYTHSRQLSVLQMQLELPKPFRKRCWQAMVRRKIWNQAICCELAGEGTTALELRRISTTVGSGDPTNREAYAAKLYFSSIFEKSFRRRQTEDWRNAALNYGYAIVRSGIARAIAEYGFIPALGIHHRSELNAFNLVDDFVEPLRPLVDLFVYELCQTHSEPGGESGGGLTSVLKRELTGLLHYSIRIHEEECSVLHAIDLMLKSFVTASRAVNSDLLVLPELIPLRRHTYE